MDTINAMHKASNDLIDVTIRTIEGNDNSNVGLDQIETECNFSRDFKKIYDNKSKSRNVILSEL